MNIAPWAVLLGAVVITLFLSTVHFTLRSPSRSRLEAAFAGAHRGEWLKNLDAHLDELVLSTGLARTICHLFILLALLILAGPSEKWGHDIAALAVAAAMVAIFGIGIPHAWARHAGEQTVALLWPVLVVLRWLMWPVTRVLTWLDIPIRRLSGNISPDLNASNVEQEILQLASESQAEGGIDADEMEMITSVIEFHDIRVGEIMTPRTDMQALAVASSRAKCIETVLGEGHSRIPVYQDTLDNVVGVLYAKDLLALENEEKFDLRKLMREPLFVPETKPISDLLKELKNRKVHIAIVLDEYGGTAGLVTIEDLLEELVGEIADEYEPAEPELLHRIDERTVEVEARIYVDDFNDELKLNLPEEEDYDTIGGFIFSTLGYIPKAGESFDYAGLHFTILEAQPRRIGKVRILLPPQEAKPG